MTQDTLGNSPLTPMSFLERSAAVFSDRTAIIDGQLRFTYRDFADRSLRGTGLLASLNVGLGDRVAVLCSNSHLLLELHNSVPMRGSVLVAMNTRLTVPELAHIISHSGSKVLIATHEYESTAHILSRDTGIPLLVGGSPNDEYEGALERAEPQPSSLKDEYQLLAINYTSGTTGRPKGVMYHHRGAFLQALSRIYHAQMDVTSAYLWTLPMFHCNGWCNTWGVTAAGSTHVCLRTIDMTHVWRHLRESGITHFSAAPTVLSMVSNAPDAGRLQNTVRVDTGGAPPSPTLLERLDRLNFHVTHLYGLTETFGPIGVNEWQPDWDLLPEPDRARLKARQGVSNILADRLRVIDTQGLDVAADGTTVGEIAARGNTVMLGYFSEPEATMASTLEGWFLTGDLAVMHPDGYIEIQDRRKDVIISGGENISSLEVERVLDAHPAVLESAVVAAQDETWGEIPVAFISLRPGSTISSKEIAAHCRTQLAGFKVPRRFEFGELPKTSTGKIQKTTLRDRANEGPLATKELTTGPGQN